MKDVVLWLFFVLLGAVVLDAARDGGSRTGAQEEAVVISATASHG